MTKYAVTAHQKYETQHGMIMEEPTQEISADTPEEAESIARNLFDKGIYSSIYIDFAHPEDAACYYNPIVGHESSGRNWVSYLEV